jgi:hypothetical protein
VAALTMAADPSLSADDVEALLGATAHRGSPDWRVPRWVDAEAAVREALHREGNTPPTVIVRGPLDGATFRVNQPVALDASVIDIEDGAACCDARWLNGGATLVPSASGFYTFTAAGRYVLQLEAHDSGGLVGRSPLITITVTNTPPAPTIAAPPPPLYAGSALFTGFASDPEELGGRVDCARLVWSALTAGDSVVPTHGCAVTFDVPTPGPHRVALTATDSQGASVTTSATVDVSPPPANPPPQIVALTPAAGAIMDSDRPQTLSVIATDPDQPLTYAWEVTMYAADGATAVATVPLGNASTVSWRPQGPPTAAFIDNVACMGPAGQRAVIHVTVTDALGAASERTIETTIVCIPG